MTGQPKRTARPVPEGYHAVTAYLTVTGVARLIQFVKDAFGAREIERLDGPGGSVAHAEVKIADTIIMMGEASGKYPSRPGNLYLYVDNADAVYEKALQAGGKSVEAPKDQFYGDRNGAVEDPSGNRWWIATRIEDLSIDEIRKRMSALRGRG